jgi:hypothetical protein
VDRGLIPQKGRGSLAKEMAEGVSPDLGHWISIARLTIEKGRDLISPVDLRSNGQEQEGARAGGAASPVMDPAAAQLRARRSSAFPPLRRYKSSRLQAGEHHRDTGKRSRATARPREARTSRSMARGGGHRRRATSQRLRATKDYGIRRKRPRERRGGSPKTRGGRSCRGR